MRCAIGVIGSLSVKVPHAKTRGYVAGKKIIGRKRHIAVDTDGRLLMVTATSLTAPEPISHAMILVAMGGNLIRRNTHP